MPLAGNVPHWLFSMVAAVTVFTLMYGIGLALVPGESGRSGAGARLRERRTGSRSSME